MKRLTLVALASLLLGGLALAQAPPLVNLQGKLTDDSGVPVPDDSYSIRFRVYDSKFSNGGDPCPDPDDPGCLWEEVQDVSTQAGMYNVLLGSTNPLTGQVFTDANRYLGVKVGTESEMFPRRVIASVPFALTGGGAVPLGSVIPWLKNLKDGDPEDPEYPVFRPVLPEGFVECNGQFYSDPNSPYHQTVLPNLNGNRSVLVGLGDAGDRGDSSDPNEEDDDLTGDQTSIDHTHVFQRGSQGSALDPGFQTSEPQEGLAFEILNSSGGFSYFANVSVGDVRRDDTNEGIADKELYSVVFIMRVK